jgi:hypothetical protein
MKKTLCEIKLIDKDNDCYVETIFNINELAQNLKLITTKLVSIEGNGKIKIVSMNSTEVFDVLKNIGYNFDFVFEEKYGLKLMYEC